MQEKKNKTNLESQKESVTDIPTNPRGSINERSSMKNTGNLYLWKYFF